jgi:hypothetical protein
LRRYNEYTTRAASEEEARRRMEEDARRASAEAGTDFNHVVILQFVL